MSKKFINQLMDRLKERRQYLLGEVKQRLREFKDSGTDRLSDTADMILLIYYLQARKCL